MRLFLTILFLTFVVPLGSFADGISAKEKKFWETYLKEVTEKAMNGDAESQLIVGVFLLQGTAGLEHNPQLGLKFLGLSAKQGNAKAMLELAGAFTTGQGVEKNEETAVMWITKSAEKGQAEAQFALAVKYYAGKGGLPVSDMESYVWLEVASRNPEIKDSKADVLEFQKNQQKN